MACGVYLPSTAFANMTLTDSNFSSRLGVSFTDNDAGNTIIAPLPRKTLSLLAAGIPRLGITSPSPRLSDSLFMRPSNPFGFSSEDYEMSSESQDDEEMDAYTELFEIIESGCSVNYRISPPVTRSRKSSVPYLFGSVNEMEQICEFDPPTLCKTPCPSKIIPKPIQIQKDLVPESTMVVQSPVSRTRNPVPNNTPFKGYRHTWHIAKPLAMLDQLNIPSDNESDDDIVLDILSPSPILFKEEWEGRKRSKSMNATI